MSLRPKQWSCGVLVIVGLGLGVGLSLAQRGDANTVKPETLLPAGAVLYVGVDGALQHEEAWKRTAAYEAVYESGLMDVVHKLVAAASAQTGGEQGPAAQASQALGHLIDHGVSLAVSAGEGAGGPPTPWAVLVLHDAAMMEDAVAQIAVAASRGEIEFQTGDIKGRSVTRGTVPNTPGIEIGWWSEGGHLVVVAGMNAATFAVDVADGAAPNITTNPHWARYRAADAGFDATRVAWLDFAALRQRFGGMPLPVPGQDPNQEPKRIDDVVKLLGLDTLQTVVNRTGYKGRALWSETVIDTPGPRSGLLALSDQTPFTLADLPPLPQGTTGFTATSFDWSKGYETITTIARGMESIVPNAQPGTVDETLGQANQALGIDLAGDLFAPLGHLHCVYADTAQAPLGLGIGAAVSVDDAARLRKAVDALLAFAEQRAGGNLTVRRVQKHGREVVLLEIQGGTASPALCITDEWLVLGVVPQTVDAFLLRLDGTLPRWAPSAEHQAGLSELPASFTALTTGDPRASYQFVLGFAPFLVGAAQAGLRQAQVLPPDFEFPLSVADVPPSELVTRPLFPNFSVAVAGPEGVRYTSRTSLPSMPFLGAFDGGTSVATTAVVVALLLPAVQQAREAARRTQSQNNLRQILLALHNYHDVFQQFPEGTHLNEKLKPEERLSWLVKVLPYLDQAPLYNQIDFEEGWEDEANQKFSDTAIPLFHNPSVPTRDEYGQAVTDYVGLAGLGKEGPTLPVTSKKAGVFAYNRATRIQDITDGTSNTIAVISAANSGPWAAGGPATIRAFTEKPYINGPDGIGGPHQGGIHAAFADGSVRFISENIDDTVLEALSTIRGGEVVGDF
jgi:prepilin-type processing-associated H-X9-DG protein